jgi:hypothetical protein
MPLKAHRIQLWRRLALTLMVGITLKVPVDAVRAEITSGKLQALTVHDYVRIRESALNVYKSEAFAGPAQPRETKNDNAPHLTAAADFEHTWPDKKHEKFTNVCEGVAAYAGRNYHLKVGFTTRISAGKDRRRSLVLVDRYPTVEFVSASTSSKSSQMASIIKDREGKQLPAGSAPPQEYAGLTVGAYRDVVTGAGAPNGLAVLCSSDDFATMVQHPLIRYHYRRQRGAKRTTKGTS